MSGMFKWTESHIDTLKSLWEEDNLSCKEIAERIGTNKSSVVGKAFRLGLRKKLSIGKGINTSVFRGNVEYYNKYQRKGRKKVNKKYVGHRFKLSESVTNYYKENYDSVVINEVKPKKKSKKSLASKLQSIENATDFTPYVMPIYMNNFIEIKTFIPRDSNRLKFKLRISRNINTKTGAISYYPNRKKVFDTYFSAKKYALRLEKEHIQYTKSLYGEYYKTHSYK